VSVRVLVRFFFPKERVMTFDELVNAVEVRLGEPPDPLRCAVIEFLIDVRKGNIVVSWGKSDHMSRGDPVESLVATLWPSEPSESKEV
jgi:hypothetical protein